MSSYLVVIEGTGEPGSNHKGVRTIIDYHTEEHFLEELARPTFTSKVIGSDLTSEEAQCLASQASMRCLIEAAVKNAGDNMVLLRAKLGSLRLVAEDEGRLEEFSAAIDEVVNNIFDEMLDE